MTSQADAGNVPEKAASTEGAAALPEGMVPTGEAPPLEGATPPRVLLVVSYFFPPTGGVGVQRTLKFVRNLRAHGWRSIVVTPAAPAYPVRDPELVAEIPGDTEVVPTACPEPAGLVGSMAARVGRRAVQPGSRLSITAPSRRVAPIRTALRAGGRWWTRLARVVLFPDDQALWWPFAVRAGRRANARQPVDAIFSSSPPVTAHLIARSLKASTGRPWIADFRDPWVGNAFAGRLSSLRQRFQSRVERRIVGAADRIVVASPSMEAAFRARYPAQAGRILCIPNGYDRGDLVGLVPVERQPGLFTIMYSGSVYGDRELGIFLDGLEQLLDRRPELRDRLRVEFVGRLNAANQRVADAYAAPGRLGGIVAYTGFLPRREALGRMRSADALLQIIADDPGKGTFVGTKTLESLAFDLPILAVVPVGDARAVLQELDWGIVADPDPESVANGIERLLATPTPTRPADPEGRYDRVRQAQRLAAILDEVADGER